MNKTELLKERDEFERRTWIHANKTKSYHARLFDAGELGYCVLFWKNRRWFNQWFNKVEQINKP